MVLKQLTAHEWSQDRAIVKVDSEGKDDAAYLSLMSEMDMKPLTSEAVAKDWDSNPNEWYHALVAIKDLPIILARS